MLRPAGQRSSALFRCLSSRLGQATCSNNPTYQNNVNYSNHANYSKQSSRPSHFESVDQQEVNKFDKFSTDQYNWYTSELTRPLRNLNKLRVPLIREQLLADRRFRQEPVNGQLPLDKFRLLDVGCGGGLLSECLARLGAHVTAIDANENNIRFAREHLDRVGQSIAGRLDYVHSDLDQLAARSGSPESGSSESRPSGSRSSEGDSSANQPAQFDGIVASEILEHVNSVETFVENCSKLLKEDGLLFVTTINQTAQAYLFAILLAENVLKLAPKNTHQYDKLVLLNGLSLLLEKSKFVFRM